MRTFLNFLVLFIYLPNSFCSYRHVALSSQDICPPPSQSTIPPSPSKTIHLDQGTAAVLSLDNVRLPYWKCDLEVKASPGHGLMVRIETTTLRTNTERRGKCVDYVQLGRDDNMPFFTWDKSGKLCGDMTGFSFDVSNGQLLVWVRLGEWQGVDQVKVSMVVTQYRKKDNTDLTNYRSCNSGSQWISQQYFCDGRMNCAMDVNPIDESPHICREEGGVTGDQAFPHSPSLPSGPPLNLLSITLVLVSSAVLMFLFVLLLVRLKMSRTCWITSTLTPPDCELPDRAGRLDTVSTVPPHTTTTMYLEPNATTSLVRGTTPDTEPPPAYQDLFPAGFKFQEKENVNSECLLNKDTRNVVKEDDQVSPNAGQVEETSDVL